MNYAGPRNTSKRIRPDVRTSSLRVGCEKNCLVALTRSRERVEQAVHAQIRSLKHFSFRVCRAGLLERIEETVYRKLQQKRRPKSEAQLVAEAQAVDRLYAHGFEECRLSQAMINAEIRRHQNEAKVPKKVFVFQCPLVGDYD
jgi:hypothetical protein